MNITIEYKNRNMEIVERETMELNLYCDKLSRDLINILSDLESILNQVNEMEPFLKLRHKLLDVAGSIRRLPDNLEHT